MAFTIHCPKCNNGKLIHKGSTMSCNCCEYKMFLKPGRINHPGLTAEQIRVRFNEMSLWDRKSIIDIARMIHSSIPGLALFTLDDGTFIEVSYAVTEHGDVEKINNIKIPAYADLDDHVIDFNVKDLY